jgi:hypothetical protein
MSWLFSQALVEASSAATCSDGAPSAPSSAIPTPLRSWLKGKTTAPFTLSLSGTTFAPLTADHGEAVLTSYLEAFPVKTSALPEAAPGYPASGRDFGASSPASFAKWDRATSSWRTPQPSLFADLTSSSVTWPRWGTMQSGVCSERTTWAPRISASGCGSSVSYPTPVVYDSTPGGPNNHYNGLGKMAKFNMWPTPDTCAGGTGPSQINRNGPRLQDVVKWPTPLTSEGKDCGVSWATLLRSGRDGGGRMQRHFAALGLPETQQTEKAALNPSWVEWLMGWPIGWTDCEPLATDRFRSWQRSHGLNFIGD